MLIHRSSYFKAPFGALGQLLSCLDHLVLHCTDEAQLGRSSCLQFVLQAPCPFVYYCCMKYHGSSLLLLLSPSKILLVLTSPLENLILHFTKLCTWREDEISINACNIAHAHTHTYIYTHARTHTHTHTHTRTHAHTHTTQ